MDRLGYSGALLATDLYDVWTLGSALAAATSPGFKPLLAVHPGLIAPTLLAKMALSFEHLHGGRLRFNVVNGSTEQLREYGLHVEHDDRYRLSAEYWSIVKRLTAGEVFDHKGRFYDLKNAGASLRELTPSRRAASRSGSAAVRRPASRWRPSTSTSTSPGASRRTC